MIGARMPKPLLNVSNSPVQRGYEIILSSDNAREEKTAIEQQHTAIFEAIRGRNPEAARLAVHAHLCSTEHVWTIGPSQQVKARKA